MKFLIMLLVMVNATLLFAQQPTDVSEKNIQNYLQARNKIAPINGAVLVAKGPKILVQEYFGFSDKEKSESINANSLFCIASSTKPFTAAAIMLLQQNKKLSVEDPISKWIEGLPASWKNERIKHLLSHTSGIPDLVVVAGTDKIAANVTALVKQYQNISPQFPVGSQFKYSNINYTFLSYIIEKASGVNYERFVTENILRPLDLNQTGFIYEYKGFALAKPYSHLFNFTPVAQNDLPFFPVIKGAASIISTTTDLLKFLNGMNTLLTKETLASMWTPVKEDYGYGWHIQEQFGKMVIKHPGSINGYVSELRYVPADSTAIIILSNIRANDLNIRYVAFDIFKLINGQPVDTDTIINPQFFGRYKLPKEFAERAKTDAAEVATQNGVLTLTIKGSSPKYLIPFARNKYFFYGEAVDLEFKPSEKVLLIHSPSFGNLKCIKE